MTPTILKGYSRSPLVVLLVGILLSTRASPIPNSDDQNADGDSDQRSGGELPDATGSVGNRMLGGLFGGLTKTVNTGDIASEVSDTVGTATRPVNAKRLVKDLPGGSLVGDQVDPDRITGTLRNAPDAGEVVSGLGGVVHKKTGQVHGLTGGLGGSSHDDNGEADSK